MITLGIIGVVAALTMPTLIANIQDNVYETQRKAAASKLAQAISLMNTEGKLEASFDTDIFIQNLKSYLKIIKVCEKSDLSGCFPDKISQQQLNLPDAGQVDQGVLDMTYNLNDLLFPPAYASLTVQHNYSELGSKSLTLYPIYNTKSVVANIKGIVTADGTSMLIGYAHGCSLNPDNGGSLNQANPPSPSNPGVLSNLSNFLDHVLGISPAYALVVSHDDLKVSSYPESTILPIAKDERACVVALIDVNNAKKPNKVDKDVFYYQSTSGVLNLVQ